jgi:tyrosyl-tRNA synthetase
VGYLKAFSLRSRAEIEELAAATAQRPAAREAQRALASELTTLLHGAGHAESAQAAGRALFGQGALDEVPEPVLAAALAEASVAPAAPGATYADLLVASGLVSSKGAARRAVAEGGAYANNERLADAEAVPGADAFLHGRWLVLRRGKRSVAGLERGAG